MTENVALGVAAALLGGMLNGSFVAPMKRLKLWQWENTWFVYSISGLLVLPWIVAFIGVPNLLGVITGSPGSALASALLFGFGWGAGSVLFGLGVARMGLALGYGLILGLITPLGTFLPLIVDHPEELRTQRGLALAVGTVIVLAGIAALATAGRIREKAAPGAASTGGVKSGFGIGLLICIISGILSPSFNFAVNYGKPIEARALEHGASVFLASNAILCLGLTAGCLANAGWAAILMQRNRTWSLLGTSKAPGSYWAWGSLMGVICFAGFMVYGSGATLLGKLGTIIGWPLFMSASLTTSNVLGALTGEWRGAPPKAWGYSMVGIGLLIAAVVVINVWGAA